MYPGEVFKTRADPLIMAAGEAQMPISGQLPLSAAFREIEYFAVKASLDEQQLGRTMVFGASGLAAVNTGQGSDVFWLLRRIEIQSESLLNYLYNPFRS